MNKFCNSNCGPCRKPKCESPCGCAEPVFSVEPMPDDPTILRFNVNGKSVWYDFSPVVKTAETATTVTIDSVERTLNHHGEKSDQTIRAAELGGILHLSDIGDINTNSISDNGILNFRQGADCGDGCDPINSGWVASNPIDLGDTSLSYLLGSDEDGELTSLRPPTDSNRFNYLSWAAQGKAKWTTPTVVSSIPNDGTYQYPVYMDPATGELVVYRRSI